MRDLHISTQKKQTENKELQLRVLKEKLELLDEQ
jgi:hypothetical protein